jgi:hypothetical protein
MDREPLVQPVRLLLCLDPVLLLSSLRQRECLDFGILRLMIHWVYLSIDFLIIAAVVWGVVAGVRAFGKH